MGSTADARAKVVWQPTLPRGPLQACGLWCTGHGTGRSPRRFDHGEIRPKDLPPAYRKASRAGLLPAGSEWTASFPAPRPVGEAWHPGQRAPSLQARHPDRRQPGHGIRACGRLPGLGVPVGTQDQGALVVAAAMILASRSGLDRASGAVLTSVAVPPAFVLPLGYIGAPVASVYRLLPDDLRHEAIRQDDLVLRERLPVLRERLKEWARVRRRFCDRRLPVFLRQSASCHVCPVERCPSLRCRIIAARIERAISSGVIAPRSSPAGA